MIDKIKTKTKQLAKEIGFDTNLFFSKELEIMINLDDNLTTKISDDEINYLKNISLYKDNVDVSKCIEKLNRYNDNSSKQITILNDLISLYNYQTKIDNSKKDIFELKKEIKTYSNIITYLKTLEPTKLIQECIN